MSDRKADVKNVLSTMGKLFFGTDEQHSKTLRKIGKDAAETFKRVRRREGAINVLPDAVEDDDDAPPAPRVDGRRHG